MNLPIFQLKIVCKLKNINDPHPSGNIFNVTGLFEAKIFSLPRLQLNTKI